MTTFDFNQYTAAIETYPDDNVEIAIANVQYPGAVLNPHESGTFDVQITNNGPVTVRDLTLHVSGENGTLVRHAGRDSDHDEGRRHTRHPAPRDENGCRARFPGAQLATRSRVARGHRRGLVSGLRAHLHLAHQGDDQGQGHLGCRGGEPEHLTVSIP